MYSWYPQDFGGCSVFGYMLQSIHEWALQAQSMGYDFNPTAVKRKANVQWMYQALHSSHQRLPQVMLVNLEDHNNIHDIICLDFAHPCGLYCKTTTLCNGKILLSTLTVQRQCICQVTIRMVRPTQANATTSCSRSWSCQQAVACSNHCLPWWFCHWQQGSHWGMSCFIYHIVVLGKGA
jgi:hypothetical protein